MFDDALTDALSAMYAFTVGDAVAFAVLAPAETMPSEAACELAVAPSVDVASITTFAAPGFVPFLTVAATNAVVVPFTVAVAVAVPKPTIPPPAPSESAFALSTV